jgi:cyclase
MQAVKVYNMRDVDELIFLDITATSEGRHPDFDLVGELADDWFMPMTVGGGVQTTDDVRRLLRVGADMVAMNTSAVENPELIRQAADRFGSQCVVVSIDARRMANGNYEVYTHSGTHPTGINPVTLAQKVVEMGAGEILLTSIDCDGTMDGYDVELIRSVSNSVSVPVVASGGAGGYDHMFQALTRGNASAVAAASIFHFTEQTPLGAKYYLAERGIPVRLSPEELSRIPSSSRTCKRHTNAA